MKLKKKLKKKNPYEDLSVDELELKASICMDSFYEFVQEFWHTAIPEKPVWNWHIKVICDALQEAAQRLFRGEPKLYDLVINVPPGMSKSAICSIFFPAWAWTNMPTFRSICASYSDTLAMDLSRKSRDVVQSDQWVKLFGNIELREDQNAKGYFVNKAGGSRFCVGTNGTVTGFHGHVIVVDDPLDPNRAVSEAELKAANRWVTETLPTRTINKEAAFTILIMQRLHQSDPAAVMLKKSKESEDAAVRHLNLPAEVQGNGLKEVRPRKFAKKYKDGLLDPKRLPRTVLRSLLIKLGSFAYSGQMLQNPIPLGGGMFKPQRLKLDVAPNVRHMRVVRFWDRAGTAGGGAYTVGTLMGLDQKKHFWILDVVRGQWSTDERESVILSTAKIDGRIVEIGLEQEPGSAGVDSVNATIRMLQGFRVRAIRPTGDKATRADAFSVQVNSGNVSIVQALWNRAYIDELQYFPNSTYKDQVDASSGAFNMLVEDKPFVGALW